MKATLTPRLSDKWGQGHYCAPRAGRKHHGIDYACAVGTIINAQTSGKVTKIGYAYGDDLSFRYVELKDQDGIYSRYFYVEPSVYVGQLIATGYPLGVSQKLGDRYPGITEHVHFECFGLDNGKKEYIDPGDYLKSL